jgi:hypothetical protein
MAVANVASRKCSSERSVPVGTPLGSVAWLSP